MISSNQAHSWRDVMLWEIPHYLTRIFGVSAFVALIGLGAHVKFFLPGNPIPVTMQTFFVLLAGVLLGPKDGPLAAVAYIGLGTAGIPLFAQGTGGGLACLAGPTAGYLFGFAAAAFLVGVMTRKPTKPLAFSAILLAGEFVILLFGCLYLAYYFGWGMEKTLILGAAPFIPGDTLKIIAVFGTSAMIRKWRCRK